MTAMMYLVAPMMGRHMDIAALLGSILGGSWAAGMMMHVVNGVLICPAIYSVRSRSWLRTCGPRAILFSRARRIYAVVTRGPGREPGAVRFTALPDLTKYLTT
jgi:hypothetical protein